MLTAYVKERLARLLAENGPRRLQPASPPPPPVRSPPPPPPPVRSPPPLTPGVRLQSHGAPDLLPSDDEDEDEGTSPPSRRLHEAGARRLLADPDSAPLAHAAPTPAEGSLLTTPPAAPRRLFGRAHLGVVSALLVIGLLCAGWSILRARPVAMASAPAAVPSIASRGAATVKAQPSSTASPTAAPPILVHVLGAVRHPGVVTLRGRSRVRDAIAAAGGLAGRAAPGDLNLAQVLEDGQQVVIGTDHKPSGEVRSSSSSPSDGSGNAGGASPPGAGAKVDLNSASQTQLEDLPGVGPVTAAKIVAWRTEHHRFSRVEELQEVDGIGPKTYADIAPHAQV